MFTLWWAFYSQVLKDFKFGYQMCADHPNFVLYIYLNFRGVGAMEIVAMDMKLRGMYIARQLSFTGVTFKIEEVPLSQKYVNMYNKSVHLVRR